MFSINHSKNNWSIQCDMLFMGKSKKKIYFDFIWHEQTIRNKNIVFSFHLVGSSIHTCSISYEVILNTKKKKNKICKKQVTAIEIPVYAIAYIIACTFLLHYDFVFQSFCVTAKRTNRKRNLCTVLLTSLPV